MAGVRAIDAEAVDLRYRSNGMHRGAQELLDGQELARRGAGDPAIGDRMAVPPANQVMGLIVEGFALELVRERERWLPATLGNRAVAQAIGGLAFGMRARQPKLDRFQASKHVLGGGIDARRRRFFRREDVARDLALGCGHPASQL